MPKKRPNSLILFKDFVDATKRESMSTDSQDLIMVKSNIEYEDDKGETKHSTLTYKYKKGKTDEDSSCFSVEAKDKADFINAFRGLGIGINCQDENFIKYQARAFATGEIETLYPHSKSLATVTPLGNIDPDESKIIMWHEYLTPEKFPKLTAYNSAKRNCEANNDEINKTNKSWETDLSLNGVKPTVLTGKGAQINIKLLREHFNKMMECKASNDEINKTNKSCKTDPPLNGVKPTVLTTEVTRNMDSSFSQNPGKNNNQGNRKRVISEVGGQALDGSINRSHKRSRASEDDLDASLDAFLSVPQPGRVDARMRSSKGSFSPEDNKLSASLDASVRECMGLEVFEKHNFAWLDDSKRDAQPLDFTGSLLDLDSNSGRSSPSSESSGSSSVDLFQDTDVECNSGDLDHSLARFDEKALLIGGQTAAVFSHIHQGQVAGQSGSGSNAGEGSSVSHDSLGALPGL